MFRIVNNQKTLILAFEMIDSYFRISDTFIIDGKEPTMSRRRKLLDTR